MELEVLQNPGKELVDFLDRKIVEFNWKNWEIKERIPLAVQMKSDDGRVLAGAAGRSFGYWFLLDSLWVSDELRGKRIGSELLSKIEHAATERGCTRCFLETLNFQAMPFYEKHGYQTQWVQRDYPYTGCQYFMVKEFGVAAQT